jgi:predicted negative regulator of RcsB-dependent stress response
MPKRPQKRSSDKRPSPGPAPSRPNPSSDGRTPAEGGDTGAGLDAAQAAAAASHAEGEASAAIAALEANQKKAIAAVVLAVLLVVTYVIYGQIKESKHIAAAEAYTVAAEAGSIDSLNLVISTYGGTVSAGNALLSKAELEQTSGKVEEAKKTLTTFVNDYADHPRAVQGWFALGHIEQQAGQLDAAQTNYDMALKVGPGSDLAPLIKLRQGDIARAKGDKEAARQIYESIPPSHPASDYINLVDERVSALDAPELPRVDPPPPPPEEKKPDPAAKKDSAAEAKPTATKKSPGQAPVPAPAPILTPDGRMADKPAGKPDAASKPGDANATPAAKPPTPAPEAAPKKPAPVAKPEPKPKADATPAPPKPADTPAPKPAETPAPTPKPVPEASKPAP